MDIRNNGWIASLLALSALSCGDAVPPPAEAAVSITLSPSGTAGAQYTCSFHTLSWTSGTAPTSNETGGLLVDGQDGASVSCKVKGDGTYTITGSVKFEDSRFDLGGSISESGTGTVSVSLWDKNLLTSIQDPACTITVGQSSLAVESGALWAQVACSHFTTPDNRYLWCAGTGIVVFKSCEE